MTSASKKKLFKRIENSLNELRPFLNADGGDITLVEITDDKIVKLEFLGACKTCHMSESTFKAAVEDTVKRADHQIRGVEVINMKVNQA